MIARYKDIDIHYTVRGIGTPLVFIHGFLENATMWDAFINHFAKTYQCIAIDLLGHGQTPCISTIHTMEMMAKTIKVVLDDLKISEATFIGHSMGGYVNLAFTDLFKAYVSGLVLLNVTTSPDSELRKQHRDRTIALIQKHREAYTAMAIAQLFSEEHRLRFETEIKNLKLQASQVSVQGMIAALEGMKVRKDHTLTLATYIGPKLMIAGKNDTVISYTQLIQEATQTQTPLITCSGGHMTYLEDETEIIHTLDSFLSKK